MNPPAIGPGLSMCIRQRFRFSEILAVACTKMIWEGSERVQVRLQRCFFNAPAP
jgi:hypothetical protein